MMVNGRNDFEGNKRVFWKELKHVGRGEQARDETVKDVCDWILRDGVEVRRRWQCILGWYLMWK